MDGILGFICEVCTMEKQEIFYMIYAASLQPFIPDNDSKPEGCDDKDWGSYKFCYAVMKSNTLDQVKQTFKVLGKRLKWDNEDFTFESDWWIKVKSYTLKEDWEYMRTYPIINNLIHYFLEAE